MLVRFWGVRGSTPTPGDETRTYGGNTSCLEVRTAGGQLLILDAGTGIRALGRQLSKEKPVGGHRIMLFLTHYHWDHIQGLPFFQPLYEADNFIYLHGFRSTRATVEEVLNGQMSDPYFPVGVDAMKAARNLYNLGEETVKIGDALITTRYLNHPQGCLGYRIADSEGVLAYCTDHEHGNPRFDEHIRLLAADADVLVYDSQYTPEEYEDKRGWGHSTYEQGIRFAQEANAARLVLFHHDPERDDRSLEALVERARRAYPNVLAAAEGLIVDTGNASLPVAAAAGRAQ